MSGPRLRASLVVRLWAAFLAVALVGAALSGLLIERSVARNSEAQTRDRLSYEVTMLGQMTATALFGPLDAADQSLQGAIKSLAESVHTNLSLLTMDGTLVADSQVSDLRVAPSERDQPEIVAARRRGHGVAVRGVGSGRRMYVASVIARDGRPLGLARASVSMRIVADQVDAVRRTILGAALIAALLAMALGAILAFGIVRPVRALADGARRVGGGDLGRRISVHSDDEIGELATAFNEMTANLSDLVGRLDRRNGEMRVVLDNVDQGLLTVDRDGVVAPEHSAAIDRWFGAPAAGARLWDVLGPLSDGARHTLRTVWERMFKDTAPTASTLGRASGRATHSSQERLPRRIACGDRWFDLTYEPILERGVVARVLVAVADVTHVVQGELEAEALHRQLVDASRRAGMAEIATGVLHNVGNVLNTVNVSAQLARERIRALKPEGIDRVAQLLREQSGEVAAFFQHDPRGKKIPEYLTALSKSVAEQKALAVAELQSLERHVDHIKEIVAAQQSHARGSTVRESISLMRVVEDALKLSASALERHAIKVELRSGEMPEVSLDRHKLLQILTNLLNNAKHAVEASGRSDKEITVSILAEGPDQARIDVRDNGVGIAAEQLTQIFAHGFTTKPQGHGFGLHMSALSAKEFGASVSCHSDGLGHGATFSVVIPLRMSA